MRSSEPLTKLEVKGDNVVLLEEGEGLAFDTAMGRLAVPIIAALLAACGAVCRDWLES